MLAFSLPQEKAVGPSHTTIMYRDGLYHGMPCLGRVRRFNKAKNRRITNYQLINKTRDFGFEPPANYGLSNCMGKMNVVKGTLKYFHSSFPPLTPELSSHLDLAVSWIEKFMSPRVPGFREKTPWEAWDGAPKNTSPGYPFNTTFKEKRDIPPDLLDEYINSPFLRRPGCSLFASFDKEEIREIINGKLKGTRQINGSSLRHYLLGMILFGQFLEWMCEQHDWLPFTVGAHVFYSFDQFMRPFSEMAKVLQIDQSGQDSLYHPEIMIRIYHLWRRLSKLNWTYDCETFVFDEIFSVILCNDRLIRTRGGNKSGSPCTLWLNCFHTWILMTICAIQDGWTYEKWAAWILVDHQLEICGDDVVTASCFSKLFVEEVYWKYGAIASTVTTPFLESTFCSGTPRWWNGNIVRIPTDSEKCLASVLYKSSHDPFVVFSQVCSFRILCVFDVKYFKLFDYLAQSLCTQLDGIYGNSREWIAVRSQCLPLYQLRQIHVRNENGFSRN